ncbi:hypothetical protein BDW22DRAFT_1363753 [Trametopsis cervina]|nr:hypothetical protein BDW22DRAFT_1363753 [Trametopsis cervina]
MTIPSLIAAFAVFASAHFQPLPTGSLNICHLLHAPRCLEIAAPLDMDSSVASHRSQSILYKTFTLFVRPLRYS